MTAVTAVTDRITYDKHKSYVIGAWLLLMMLTAVTWWLGADHEMAGLGRDAAMVSILVVSFAKIYVVGNAFMELREAARWLQNLFLAWCIGLCAVLTTMYFVV